MLKVLFLGAGKMASAIAAGAVGSGKFKNDEFLAYDISTENAKKFSEVTTVSCITNNIKEYIENAEAIVLAVKPQNVGELLNGVFSEKSNNKLLISIAAGVEINTLKSSNCERIIRVMPNTPALVKEGATVYACSNSVTNEDIQLVEDLFGSVGIVEKVEEKYINAVTGLSGSGPAYVFSFIQALADGGVAEGLPRALAKKLAVQTVLGSAKMAFESEKHLNELRDEVASPGGTTIYGLEKLEENAFNYACISAVRAAVKRSEELGKGK